MSFLSGLPLRPEFLGSVFDIGRPETEDEINICPIMTAQSLTNHAGGGAASPGVAHVLQLSQVAPGHSLLCSCEAVAGQLLVASLRRL